MKDNRTEAEKRWDREANRFNAKYHQAEMIRAAMRQDGAMTVADALKHIHKYTRLSSRELRKLAWE